ncbi:MAG TPA: ABC transporter permease [Bradyrhizobium sp.]|uniref:ABC transporter permease n=1 Tax=Bradyrhizobium sp. TaxID=376 RepID=UPI002C464278|nr:ABC transporter permease [Bradyrhizobium sp.]HLZ06097.1 ABC transporter permease [Bradyrhizobium sp.]
MAIETQGGWRWRTAPSHPHSVFLLCWFLGGVLLAFIAIPLIALAGYSAANLAEVARMADVRAAILLSLEAAFLSATFAALIGVPLAYVLARSSFPGKGAVAALIDLPLAVPHTVAGIGLLMVFGRHGPLGEPLHALVGIKFWGTIAGIVVAMMFVSAPYTVNAARMGFEAVDPRLEKIARTLGLGPWRTFMRISLPLAWRGIMTGITLTYARSISEFGAVVILVYYPMTAPVKIYELFLRIGLDQAAGAAVLLLIVSLSLFVLLRYLAHQRETIRENR